MATLPGVFFGDHAAGTDSSWLVANVPGGSGPDYLFDKIRDSLNDTPDVVSGSRKDDIFYIQPGDTAIGGKGYDIVVEMPSSGGHLEKLVLDDSVEAGVLGGTQNAGIRGNSADNDLVGNSGDNKLIGASGKDVLIGNEGGDRLLGGSGNDKLSGGIGDDHLFGGSGKDKLDGGIGDDHLFGGSGNDKLFGRAGDDHLFGSGGKDTILGGAGEDTIFGGQGKDHLAGGGDADVFGFLKHEHGVDVITDFQPGVDKIDLSDFHTDFASLKFKNSGHDVVVTVGSGKNAVEFKLLGFHKHDLDGSFFQF